MRIISAKWALDLGASQVRQILFLLGGFHNSEYDIK